MSTDRRTIAYWKNVATQSYRQMEIYKRESERYKRLYESELENCNYWKESRDYWMEIGMLKSSQKLDNSLSKTSNLTISYRSKELIKLQLEAEKEQLKELEKEFFECVFIRLNPSEI